MLVRGGRGDQRVCLPAVRQAIDERHVREAGVGAIAGRELQEQVARPGEPRPQAQERGKADEPPSRASAPEPREQHGQQRRGADDQQHEPVPAAAERVAQRVDPAGREPLAPRRVEEVERLGVRDDAEALDAVQRDPAGRQRRDHAHLAPRECRGERHEEKGERRHLVALVVPAHVVEVEEREERRDGKDREGAGPPVAWRGGRAHQPRAPDDEGEEPHSRRGVGDHQLQSSPQVRDREVETRRVPADHEVDPAHDDGERRRDRDPDEQAVVAHEHAWQGAQARAARLGRRHIAPGRHEDRDRPRDREADVAHPGQSREDDQRYGQRVRAHAGPHRRAPHRPQRRDSRRRGGGGVDEDRAEDRPGREHRHRRGGECPAASQRQVAGQRVDRQREQPPAQGPQPVPGHELVGGRSDQRNDGQQQQRGEPLEPTSGIGVCREDLAGVGVEEASALDGVLLVVEHHPVDPHALPGDEHRRQ